TRMMTITVINQTRRKVDVRRLKRLLVKTVKLLGVEQAEWSITLVNDSAMGELHQQTMNDPTTTEVLTFDLRDVEAIRKTRAEVELDTVLCVDEAGRRAKELRHTLDDELLLYGIHSVLHVQGYDDVKAREAKRMHQREDEILVALGVGPVYAAKASAGGRKVR